MGPRTSQDQFARNVLGRYTTLTEARGLVNKSAQHEAFTRGSTMPPTGHPDFASLHIGESGHCHGVAVFIDLVQFTARTFWDSPVDVLMLNTAVMSQVAAVIEQCGGYVLGMRGDGVFACFGDDRVQDNKVSAACAMIACAFALDAVQNSLNEMLEMYGQRPVQIRAGADFGRLDFVRVGSETASEVNVVGFAANFASKCEKSAASWEVVIGEGLADLLPIDHYSRHEDSPKSYQRDGEVRRYSFHQAKWRPYLAHLDGIEELEGKPLSSIRY